MQAVNVQTVGTLAAPSLEFFEVPAWKRLRYFSMVHLIFEIIMMIAGFLTTIVGGVFPLLVMVGAANVACKCCCKEDAGKCSGCAVVVLNSIGFIGSCVDFFVLGRGLHSSTFQLTT